MINELRELKEKARKNEYVDLFSLEKKDAYLFLAFLEAIGFRDEFIRVHYPQYFDYGQVKVFILFNDIKTLTKS